MSTLLVQKLLLGSRKTAQRSGPHLEENLIRKIGRGGVRRKLLEVSEVSGAQNQLRTISDQYFHGASFREVPDKLDPGSASIPDGIIYHYTD